MVDIETPHAVQKMYLRFFWRGEYGTHVDTTYHADNKSLEF